eukprot:m.474395 g.474395  ORF g.474395 m.474395 type:complete len:77 (+) comp36173_c0_seq1:345-575(+)
MSVASNDQAVSFSTHVRDMSRRRFVLTSDPGAVIVTRVLVAAGRISAMFSIFDNVHQLRVPRASLLLRKLLAIVLS